MTGRGNTRSTGGPDPGAAAGPARSPAFFPRALTAEGKQRKLLKARIPLVSSLIVLLGWASLGRGEEAQSFSVQVGAFAERKNAEHMATALARQGYTPYVFETLDEKGRRWSIVRIGDYSNFEEARAAAGAYEADQGQPAVITPLGSGSALRPPSGPPAEPAGIPSAPVEDESGPADVEGGAPAPGTRPARPEGARPDQAPAGPGADPNLRQLEQQVETLQTEVERMRREAAARKSLEITDEEKAGKEKEILTAAGRQYILLRRYTLGLEYDLRYEYASYDVIEEATTVEQIANHTLVNSLFAEFALLDNLTFSVDFPFVYKFDKTGSDDEKDVTDLGDLSLGIRYQPLKTGSKFPTLVTFGTFAFDTGRSPYEINPRTELATGNGYKSASLGLSLSKTIDPIVAFGTVSYAFAFSVDGLNQRRLGDETLTGVEPGDTVGLNIGFGYAMSYKVSLNFSYLYSYRFEDSYFWETTGKTTSGSRTFSILSIGTGWQLSRTLSVIMRIGVGLTSDDPDFTFSLRMPFQFELGG